MDKIALQAKLDEQKWNDSVSNHRDMCGAYDYCAFCDKSVALPCATAFEEMNKPQILPASDNEHPVQVALTAEEENEDVTELHSSLGKKFDYDKVMAKKAARKSLTFAEKYALADDIIKERYAILKDALTATAKGTPKIDTPHTVAITKNPPRIFTTCCRYSILSMFFPEKVPRRYMAAAAF